MQTNPTPQFFAELFTSKHADADAFLRAHPGLTRNEVNALTNVFGFAQSVKLHGPDQLQELELLLLTTFGSFANVQTGIIPILEAS